MYNRNSRHWNSYKVVLSFNIVKISRIVFAKSFVFQLFKSTRISPSPNLPSGIFEGFEKAHKRKKNHCFHYENGGFYGAGVHNGLTYMHGYQQKERETIR